MTLAPLPGTSGQGYVPPTTGFIPDLASLANPSLPAPSVRGIGPHRVRGPVPISKDHPNLYLCRVEWYDARGGPRQIGYPNEHAAVASGTLVGDDQGILRLPFLTTAATSPDPAASGYRISSTNALGVMVAGFASDIASPLLFRETSATDPTIIAVTGYVATGANMGILHLGQIHVNGTPYLGIGLSGNAANNTLQVISDYANPPTSSSAPVGIQPTYWFYQTPIDGDAIIAQVGSTLVSFRTDVAAGSTVIVTRRTGLITGGYGVGLVNIDGVPGVAWVAPTRATTLIYNAQAATQGRVLMADLRGFNIREVKFPLKWVTFATEFYGGIFACDQEHHYYWPAGAARPIPVDSASDYAANSNKVRKCRGHWRKGGKMRFEINETITASGTGATTRYRMEYDPTLNTVKQISASTTLSTTGELSIGGPLLPSSEQNDFEHVYADGSWYRQYSPPDNVLGYASRKTSGAAATTGQAYEASGSLTTMAVVIPGFEEARFNPWRAVFGGDVDAGGTGGTPATVRLTETGVQRFVEFTTQHPTGRVQVQYFPPGRGTTYRPQATILATRQSGGTDPTKFTPQCYPVAIDYLVYKPPLGSREYALPTPTEYQSWDQSNR